MEKIIIRDACEKDLDNVNLIRKQVHELHVKNRPDIFRADGWEGICHVVYERFESETGHVVVAAMGEKIVGFAQITLIDVPETPLHLPKHQYHVQEFGVDEHFKRMGIATRLIAYLKEDAKKKGYNRIDLDVFEFNDTALAFYEEVGFHTFRRYMELYIEEE